MNTDALVALRAGQKPKSAWHAPTLADLHHGRILAFDQSLSATGVVLLTHVGDQLVINDADVITTPSLAAEVKSTREHDVRRALILRRNLTSWMNACLQPSTALVVYEAVPEGPYIRHIESSLLSAMVIHLLVEDCHLRFADKPSIPARTHKKFVTGNANASKADVRKVVTEWAPTVPIVNMDLVKNEATRDALCVAVTALAKIHG